MFQKHLHQNEKHNITIIEQQVLLIQHLICLMMAS
jgi:hypothetical protein